MRKAHEAEVQKEISKFKEEYLRKVPSSHDIGVLHREHELVFYVFEKIINCYTNFDLN